MFRTLRGIGYAPVALLRGDFAISEPLPATSAIQLILFTHRLIPAFVRKNFEFHRVSSLTTTWPSLFLLNVSRVHVADPTPSQI